MSILRKFLHSVAHDRFWLWSLVGVNLLGSLYGFYWYRGQLAETPVIFWPIVPDSPGSTFLLTIWLALLASGADWRKPGMQWLGAIAFVSNMKYGLWTSIVLPEAGIRHGWLFEYVYLTGSHLAMWVEAMIFARFYKPALVPALGALLYMWFQDLVDYGILGTWPTLPYEEQLPFARAVAIGLSTVWGLFLVLQARFDRKVTQSYNR